MGNVTLTNIIPESIGVMEDNSKDRVKIKNSLTKLGLNPIEISDSQQAEDLAKKKKILACILDINMGSKRTGEGLTAAERIKRVNKDCFVSILTNYATDHERQAEKIKVDIYKPKSININKDVYSIVLSLLERRALAYQISSEKLMKFLNENNGNGNVGNVRIDKNTQTFKSKLTNPQWVREHQDMYVAFDLGVLIDKDRNIAKLLKRVRRKVTERSVFVARVETEDQVFDIPTPFFEED